MPSLYENARSVAKTAGSAVLCGVGGAQRAAMDLLDKKTFGATNIATAIGNRLTGRDPSTESKARRLNSQLRSFCNVPPDGAGPRVEDVPYIPGVPGGQCPGVLYNFDVTFVGDNGSGPSNYSRAFSVIGPIEGYEVRDPGSSVREIYIVGQTERRIYQRVSSNKEEISDFQWVSIERADGEPDDCGDRGPSLPDSEPITNPSPSPTVNPDGDGNGNQYTFAPTVGFIYADVDGSIKVPVTVNIPEIDINLDFDINLTDPTADPEPVGDPYPTDDDGRPDPIPDGPEQPESEGGDGEDCDPCEKIDDLRDRLEELLDVTGEGTLSLEPCVDEEAEESSQGGTTSTADNTTSTGDNTTSTADNTTSTMGSNQPEEDTGIAWTGQGMTGLFAALNALGEGLAILQDCVNAKGNEAVALMPSDMYSEFVMESRLTLYFTTVEDYPKRNKNSSKWSIEIPNPIENLDWCTHFENFSVQKGSHFSRVTWNGSKVKTGLYCSSREEGGRVLDLIQALSTATPSRRRFSDVDNPKVPLSTKSIRVVRAYRTTIENGEVTECLLYAPPNSPCQASAPVGG